MDTMNQRFSALDRLLFPNFAKLSSFILIAEKFVKLISYIQKESLCRVPVAGLQVNTASVPVDSLRKWYPECRGPPADTVLASWSVWPPGRRISLAVSRAAGFTSAGRQARRAGSLVAAQQTEEDRSCWLSWTRYGDDDSSALSAVGPTQDAALYQL